VRFLVLMTASMKLTVWQKLTNVSEVLTASIIRVQYPRKLSTSSPLPPDPRTSSSYGLLHWIVFWLYTNFSLEQAASFFNPVSCGQTESEHWHLPVDEIEEVLCIVFHSVTVGVQMSRALGRHKLAIVCTKTNRAITLPNQVKEGIGRPEYGNVPQLTQNVLVWILL
jgi:hypothetical protein